MIENKEKKNLSWVVTGGGGSFGLPIFSDKVLQSDLMQAGGSERSAK